MEASVRAFFEGYERFFNLAVEDRADLDEIKNLYASEFIAASPSGVMTGKNDDGLKSVMAQGYERYRAIGTKHMRIRTVDVAPIDPMHCLATVGWQATYTVDGKPDAKIDFDVHYLVQASEVGPRIFGWITGDEQAVLEAHGIV